MNERIRELAEQATKYAFEWAEGDSKINPEITPDKWLKAYQEKFAELIVRECMLQCIKVENDVELSDYEGGFKDGALLCYQEIQEHFGVEE